MMACCPLYTTKVGLGVWRNPNWVGTFYPYGTKPKNMLETYARYLNSVEGNTTFHVVPPLEQLQSWATRTPENFKFSFKFPRHITHTMKLNGADKEIEQFLNLLEKIPSKVGTVMIQLPPSFDASYMDRLLRLPNKLSPTFEYAIEFRHPDFFTNPNLEIYELIRKGVFSLVILDNRLSLKETTRPPLKKKAIQVDPGPSPIVRYVDFDGHFDNSRINAWCECLKKWETEGRNPTFFAHTETDNHAPEIAKKICNHVWKNECQTFNSPQLSLF